MTSCPKRLKYVAVSTTIKPVTHVADVAVKNASTSRVDPPDVVAAGSMSRTVPT